jgi:hypothetical protein
VVAAVEEYWVLAQTELLTQPLLLLLEELAVLVAEAVEAL